MNKKKKSINTNKEMKIIEKDIKQYVEKGEGKGILQASITPYSRSIREYVEKLEVLSLRCVIRVICLEHGNR